MINDGSVTNPVGVVASLPVEVEVEDEEPVCSIEAVVAVPE